MVDRAQQDGHGQYNVGLEEALHSQQYYKMPEYAPQMIMLLGRLDSKLDAALFRLEQHERQAENLENRVDTLERGKAYVLGIVLTVSIAASTAVTLFGKSLVEGIIQKEFEGATYEQPIEQSIPGGP